MKILVAKIGMDGHDVGARVVCRALMAAGHEVLYTGLRQTVDQVVAAARDEDVDLIAFSCLSGAHLPIARRLARALAAEEMQDVPWAVGGVIPADDVAVLTELGAVAVFPTGAPLADLAPCLEAAVQGHAAPAPSPRVTHGPRPHTLECGIAVQPVYTAADVDRTDTGAPVGAPGAYPFTRGIHREMYRKQPFTMRQYSGFGTAEETRARFAFLLEQGNTGLNVALDLPSQCGLDSDDPLAEGEVGRVGMAVDTVEDMLIAFDGIDLDKVSVSLTINGTAPILLAMFQAVAEHQGRDLSSLRGTLQNDILKEFIGRGTWIFPVDASVKLVGDTIEYCAQHLPKYSPLSICGYHVRETGADPVQEMAIAFCIGRAYIDHVLERGLDIDEFAPRLSFNFDVFGSLFEQVAKFRAGRRLWARIIREEYGAERPQSCWLRMIAGGGGGGLTVQQPEVNIVRGAYYALISALSGTQTMALCSFDEAYTIPSEHSARLSLRTMQVLIEEMGLTDTVDPLGGSYYVETLTNQMETAMRAAMADLDARGGIQALIASGEIQAQLSRQAYDYQRGLADGSIPKVGVNRHVMDEESRPVALHPYRPEQAERQVARLNDIRARRDARALAQGLEGVRAAARAGQNVMPALVAAVKTRATVGELTRALADVYGRHREPVRF